MGTFTVGSVVLIPFPFSDLSKAKLRPALVVAETSYDDWILCQITSQSYSDSKAIMITDEHFQQGSLQTISYVRPGKLFTANASLITRQVGELKPAVLKQVVEPITAILWHGVK